MIYGVLEKCTCPAREETAALQTCAVYVAIIMKKEQKKATPRRKGRKMCVGWRYIILSLRGSISVYIFLSNCDILSGRNGFL